jgi:general L-amino acid transport system substrate-binding protein
MRVNRVLLIIALLAVGATGSAFFNNFITAQDASPVFAQAEASGKLAEIQARGSLKCGVSGGLPGFSIQDTDTSEWSGLDVDFCRALAAAIFGDAEIGTNLEIIPLTSDQRFTALQAGEVDILHRNTTWTLTRDLTLTSDFGPSTFYDGQGILVPVSLGVGSLAELEGATFCSTSGTTTEKNITDAYRALFGSDPTLVLRSTPEENLVDLQEGACNVLTSDKSQLAGLQTATDNPADWVILPDTLSKEPLGPMYVDNDSLFGDLVNWSVYATFQAEELGLTSENIESMMGGDDIGLQRFLGESEDNYGGFLGGLDAAWAANIIKEVGNYGEIYDRNIVPINIPREGSLNASWTDGGLLYAPAWR